MLHKKGHWVSSIAVNESFISKPLDDCMAKTGLYYARFMDGWVVVAPTRWKLRKAIAIVNKTLNMLRVEQAPDKTFIGSAERGFDILGYHRSQNRYMFQKGLLADSLNVYPAFMSMVRVLTALGNM